MRPARTPSGGGRPRRCWTSRGGCARAAPACCWAATSTPRRRARWSRACWGRGGATAGQRAAARAVHRPSRRGPRRSASTTSPAAGRAVRLRGGGGRRGVGPPRGALRPCPRTMKTGSRRRREADPPPRRHAGDAGPCSAPPGASCAPSGPRRGAGRARARHRPGPPEAGRHGGRRAGGHAGVPGAGRGAAGVALHPRRVAAWRLPRGRQSPIRGALIGTGAGVLAGYAAAAALVAGEDCEASVASPAARSRRSWCGRAPPWRAGSAAR